VAPFGGVTIHVGIDVSSNRADCSSDKDDTGQYVNASIVAGLASGTLSTYEIKKSLRRIKKLKQAMLLR
jgi:hypothetical protein